MLIVKPTVDFSVAPTGAALVYNINGNTYPYSTQVDLVVRASDTRYDVVQTTTNTSLTFTAIVDIPATSDLLIVQYKWNFGNGTVGYGPVVTHTYTVAVPTTVVTLSVTDSAGNHWSAGRSLNLRYGEVISAGIPITVGP